MEILGTLLVIAFVVALVLFVRRKSRKSPRGDGVTVRHPGDGPADPRNLD